LVLVEVLPVLDLVLAAKLAGSFGCGGRGIVIWFWFWPNLGLLVHCHHVGRALISPVEGVTSVKLLARPTWGNRLGPCPFWHLHYVRVGHSSSCVRIGRGLALYIEWC